MVRYNDESIQEEEREEREEEREEGEPSDFIGFLNAFVNTIMRLGDEETILGVYLKDAPKPQKSVEYSIEEYESMLKDKATFFTEALFNCEKKEGLKRLVFLHKEVGKAARVLGACRLPLACYCLELTMGHVIGCAWHKGLLPTQYREEGPSNPYKQALEDLQNNVD